MKVSNKIVQMGIDLGKDTFHLFGVDESGSRALKKQLRRKRLLEYFANPPACLVGMKVYAGATGQMHRNLAL